MVLTADYARRQGENVTLSETDNNLFNRFQGSTTPVPVIPLCKQNPDFANPADECSTGSITFWNDEGRAIYNGLLMKLQKRMTNHFQFVVSYALQKATDENAWNAAKWMAGYGQYLPAQQPHRRGNLEHAMGIHFGLELDLHQRYAEHPNRVEPDSSRHRSG